MEHVVAASAIILVLSTMISVIGWLLSRTLNGISADINRLSVKLDSMPSVIATIDKRLTVAEAWIIAHDKYHASGR